MKTLIGKYILLAVIYLIAVPPISVSSAYENADAVKAYDLFTEGQEALENAKLGHDKATAEEKLLRARNFVDQDYEELNFWLMENRLIPGSGRWPKYKAVRIDKTRSYFPNRLISQIRFKAPPKPLVVIEVIRHDNEYELVGMVTNTGKTRMENLRISIAGQSGRIIELLPGNSSRVRIGSVQNLDDVLGSPVTVEERYGFVACELSF